MAIDSIVREVRDDVIGHLNTIAEQTRQLPWSDYFLSGAVCLLGLGMLLAANEWWKVYLKRKEEAHAAALVLAKKDEGFRMILQERRDKIDRIIADGLNDLLLEAEMAGKISSKELDQTYQRLAEDLEMPDLIPKERRLRIVKQQIKGRLNKAPKGQPPKVPVTGKPEPLRQRIGTFANTFWRTKGA